MTTEPIYAAPGYQFDAIPDLSRLEERERLSQSAVDGFFAIIEKWRIPFERAGELLGGVPRSSVYKLKTAAGTLRHDELTRISYIVGIYKALHILLPEELADRWMTRPNDTFYSAGGPLSTLCCGWVFQVCSRFEVCLTQHAAGGSWPS